jgi:hypothetical protein
LFPTKQGLEVPLRDIIPLVATTAPITDDLRERQVTRRERLIEPALAYMSFCQYITRTRAELQIIESSSDEESESERDLPMGPTGLVVDGPVTPLATQELARLE